MASASPLVQALMPQTGAQPSNEDVMRLIQVLTGAQTTQRELPMLTPAVAPPVMGAQVSVPEGGPGYNVGDAGAPLSAEEEARRKRKPLEEALYNMIFGGGQNTGLQGLTGTQVSAAELARMGR